jgi:hypothetical protein
MVEQLDKFVHDVRDKEKNNRPWVLMREREMEMLRRVVGMPALRGNGYGSGVLDSQQSGCLRPEAQHICKQMARVGGEGPEGLKKI